MTHQVDITIFTSSVIPMEGTGFHLGIVSDEAFVELSVITKPDFDRWSKHRRSHAAKSTILEPLSFARVGFADTSWHALLIDA